MRELMYKLRHIILFAVLIGSDVLIGMYGQHLGLAGEEGIFGVVIFAIFVVVIVEFLFKGQ